MIEKKRRNLLLSFVFISFALVLSFLLIFAKFLINQPLLEQLLHDKAEETYKERESYLNNYLTMAKENILSIRKSTFFLDYLDSEDHATNLENLLMTYAASRSDFMKIRFIDHQGLEKIRIERDSYGDPPFITPKDKLQDKSDRYFFTDSLSKTPETIWFSAIDLNEDNNVLEYPYTPTLRAILPISKDNTFAGILMINYFVGEFLQDYANPAHFSLSLFNDDGYTIYYGLDPAQTEEKSWGNSLDDGYNILSEIADNPLVYSLDVPIQNGLHIALKVKDSYLEQERKTQHHEYLIIFSVILVSSLILTYFITHFLSRTLLNFDQIQNLYDSLIDASSIAKIGFWELDASTHELICNDSLTQIFEFSRHPGKMTYSDFLSYLPEEDQQKLKNELEQSISEKRDFNLFHRLVAPDGSYRFVEERGKHFYDRKGKHLQSIGSIYDLTDKYLSEQKYKLLLDNAPDGIFIMDLEGNLIEYNNRSLELLGYRLNEISSLNVFDWDKEVTQESWKKMIEQLAFHSIELERIHTRKDGSRYFAHITANLVSIKNQTYVYSSVRDVSKQKDLQKALDDTRLRWQFAVEGNKDDLWDWNIDTNDVYFSPQWKAMLGFSENEIKGSLSEWKKRVHPDDFEKVLSDLQRYLGGESTSYVNEHRVLCKDGSYIWIRDRGIIIARNADGSPHRMIGTHTDISEYIQALETIKKQNYLDELTQLHNRKAYNERVLELLEQYNRYKVPFSLIMLDIDFFKRINDTYGHSTGDVVLQKLSILLTAIGRKNDYLYRIGGEEFVFLLTGTNLNNAMLFAEKARSTIQNELILPELDAIKVTISLGVTEVSSNDTVDSVFHKADQALYKAKVNGRNQACSFE